MAYSKQTWTDDVSAVTGARMTHIEQGIYDNSLATDKINPSGTATTTAEIEAGQISDVIGLKSLKLKGQTSQYTTTGKNKLAIKQLTTQTINGVTFTPHYTGNKLDYVNVNGTATATAGYFLDNADVDQVNTYTNELPSGTYILDDFSGSSSVNIAIFFRYYTSGSTFTTINSVENSRKLTINSTFKYTSYIRINNGATVNNMKFYPQLETGSTQTTYEPYTNGASPNPDYPQEVNNVSGDNVIGISNKNLIEYSFKGYNITSQGKFETGGTSLDFDVHIAKVKAGTTYTITPETNVIAYFDERPTITSQAYNNAREVITNTNRLTPTRSSYIAIRTATSNTAQLEKGTSATSFVAHQGNNFDIDLPIELCKISTYEDYIYKKDGKWYKHKAVQKIKLDGSETYVLDAELTTVNRFRLNITSYKMNNIASTNSGMCNQLKIANAYSQDDEHLYSYNAGSNTWLYLFYNKTRCADISGLQTWLSANNLIVYGILTTPIDEEITYTPLIRQLDELYNSGLYDVTNISQDNSSEAFILDLEACKNNINGIVEYIRR